MSQARSPAAHAEGATRVRGGGGGAGGVSDEDGGGTLGDAREKHARARVPSRQSRPPAAIY